MILWGTARISLTVFYCGNAILHFFFCASFYAYGEFYFSKVSLIVFHNNNFFKAFLVIFFGIGILRNTAFKSTHILGKNFCKGNVF